MVILNARWKYVGRNFLGWEELLDYHFTGIPLHISYKRSTAFVNYVNYVPICHNFLPKLEIGRLRDKLKTVVGSAEIAVEEVLASQVALKSNHHWPWYHSIPWEVNHRFLYLGVGCWGFRNEEKENVAKQSTFSGREHRGSVNVAAGALVSETTYTAGVPKGINLIMLSSYSLQLRVLLTDTRTQLAKERYYLSKAVQLKFHPHAIVFAIHVMTYRYAYLINGDYLTRFPLHCSVFVRFEWLRGSRAENPKALKIG